MALPVAARGAPRGRYQGGYQRHRPETTTLYAVVRDHVETLYATVAAGFEGAALPAFVRREFEAYLDCGLLCRGFAHMKCEACVEQHLVAFSCKGRGFCPSCLGRRMCQTFTDSVLGWYRRRLRKGTRERTESGAVVVVQRASSDLKLNPHLHVIFLDGVYAPAAADGQEDGLVFRALPRLSTTAVADVLQVARVRILGYLQRRGVIEVDEDALRVSDELAERDPALAQLASAAVSGLAPAGPELRRRPVELPFPGRAGVLIPAPLRSATTGSPFTLPRAPGPRTRRGAKRCPGTCSARRSPPNACSPLPTVSCASR